jgi:hypothetical protein
MTRSLAARYTVGLAFGFVILAGCQSPALVHTARTLPRGATDLSLSLNLTRASIGEVNASGVAIPVRDFNLPNPVPEVMLDHGITDDVELGLRLSLGSGLIEAHGVMRFIEAANSTLHVAVAPSAGYRVLGLVYGPVFTLPLLVTYDLTPTMSLNVGPLVSFAAYSVPRSLRFGDALDISGDTLYAGGGVGLELRPAGGIHLMPSVEVQRSVSRRGDLENLPVIDLLFLGLTLGWASSG